MSDKMTYNGREIVLEEQWDDVESSCEGCVLEHVNNCVSSISPAQHHTVCCPSGVYNILVFKYKEE